MNNIQIFNNPEFGDIRTVLIDNEPWFVGRDIAVALGYAKPEGAIRNNVDKDDTLTEGVVDSKNRMQKTLIINESGMYSLIFGSKLESAKKFKKWVTSEVLPSIRRTGSYGKQLPQTTGEKIALLAQGHIELKAEIDDVRADLQEFKQDMPLLAVECDRITTAVSKRGIDALGGKNSNSYKDASLRGKVYQDIHREIKRQLGVTTYKAIKRSQCDLAVDIVTRYELPLVLQEEIENCNAQIGML